MKKSSEGSTKNQFRLKDSHTLMPFSHVRMRFSA